MLIKSCRRGFMRCSRRDEPWGSHQSAARALKWETSSGLTEEDEECHRGRAMEGVARRGVDERVACLRVRRHVGRRRGAAMAARARRCWRSETGWLLDLGEDDKADDFGDAKTAGCAAPSPCSRRLDQSGTPEAEAVGREGGTGQDTTGSARVTLARVCQSLSAISNGKQRPPAIAHCPGGDYESRIADGIIKMKNRGNAPPYEGIEYGERVLCTYLVLVILSDLLNAVEAAGPRTLEPAALR